MTFILPLTKACAKVPSSRDGIALMPTSHPTSRSHQTTREVLGSAGEQRESFYSGPW